MRLSRKFQTIVSTLLLFFFAIISRAQPAILNQSNSNTKGMLVYDEFTVSDETDYFYNYEYDGYLDEVYYDCDLYHNTGTEIDLEGKTYPEYGSLSFNIRFLFDSFSFETRFDYCGQHYSEDISCYTSSTGSINAELQYCDTSNYDELKTYYIDDYKDPVKLENLVLQIEETDENDDIELSLFYEICIAIGAIVALVAAYVIVAEIAEEDKVESNYIENKKRDTSSFGVGFECLIYNQEEGNYIDHSPAEYKFGFTTFAEVGCEVASVYNLMIKLDRPEWLSDTIYKFEKWGLEYSVGWGYLGSNPKQIDHYLYHAGLIYTKIDCENHWITNTGKAFNTFKQQAISQKEAHLIVSAWNVPISKGIHTYYVEKTNITDDPFITYNWDSDYFYPLSIEKLDDLVQKGQKFIVGYIIYE